MLLVLAIACIAPLAIQRYMHIDPGVITAIGIPAIVVLGFLGSVAVLLPVPVLSIVFSAAAVVNPFAPALAAAFGITLGMAVCYYLGRKGLSRFSRSESVSPVIPDKALTAYDWSRNNVVVSSFLLAATPNPIFDYAGYAAGAGRFNPRRFLLGTFLGKLTQSIVIGYVGSTFGDRVINLI